MQTVAELGPRLAVRATCGALDVAPARPRQARAASRWILIREHWQTDQVRGTVRVGIKRKVGTGEARLRLSRRFLA